MDKTPRSVITSRKAKDHIAVARSVMDEMNASISEQRQRVQGENQQKDQIVRDEQRFNATNQHEKSMQDKKLSIDSLI